MKYRVIFTPQVNRDLIDLWIESNHQREFTLAVDGLVRQLEANPIHVGESRNGNRRVAFDWPVGIEFEIDDGERQVKIYHLWTFARRSS